MLIVRLVVHAGPHAAHRHRTMSAPPQASFLQAFRAAPLLPTLGAGVVAGTVAVMMAITYAAVIFSGELEVYQSAGIGLALFSAALLCAVNAMGSSYPGTIAVPQDAPAILLGG